MSKPTDDIEFATDGGALVSDPGGGKKKAGFDVDEAPPAHWFDWLFRAYWRWISWFDSVLNTDSHNTIQISADSSSTRPAIKGIGNNGQVGIAAESAAGIALSVLGDITSPVQASMRLTPQNAIPTGAHLVGDAFMDSIGRIFICTVAGTPGTWSHLKGTNTNDSPNTGDIGEYIKANAFNVNAAASTNPFNVTSIALTAGDWDVSGTVAGIVNGATITAFHGSINTVSATLGTNGTTPGIVDKISRVPTTTDFACIEFPPKRYSLSGSSTVYLVSQYTYSAGTPQTHGEIQARRVR